MKTFNQKLGRGITDNDISTMAKFDVLTLKRALYDNVNGDTWGALKAQNPSQKHLIYMMGSQNSTDQDCLSPLLNCDAARYRNATLPQGLTHPMGNVQTDMKHLILGEIPGSWQGYDYCPDNPYNPATLLMDFGYGRWPGETGGGWVDYLATSIDLDILKQPWTADGIYLDNCSPCRKDVWVNQDKYTHNNLDNSMDSFPRHMNWFLNEMTKKMHDKGQLLAANRTKIQYSDFNCNTAWEDLDDNSMFTSKLDYALEEGAFFHLWGSAPINWWTTKMWQSSLDTIANINNYYALVQSQCEISRNGTGKDNYGNSVDFWQAVWFNLCSFALGKSSQTLIGFDGNDIGYTEATEWWFEEYDHMDEGKNLNLGNAVENYKVTSHQGYNLFWRQFSNGYVYVNPNNVDLTNIQLPETCKRLTHGNFKDSLSGIPNVNSINLNRHAGAILRKVQTSAPGILSPQNLRIMQ